jgi:uncharacterized membrane protein YeaQ/YmgE (transglycosylase-associated protein family)
MVLLFPGTRQIIAALPTSPRNSRLLRAYLRVETSSTETENLEKEHNVGIITWIIIGGIAGALAKLIMPGDDPGGIIVTILIGIAGAFVGGFLTSLIGIGGGGFIWTIIVATIGAIVLLAIYRALVGGRTARR